MCLQTHTLWVLEMATAAMLGILPATPSLAEPHPLTRASAAWLLVASSGAESQPLKLKPPRVPEAGTRVEVFRGVVSFFSPERNELFLQDEKRGLRISPVPKMDSELAVGQLLEVQGQIISARSGRQLLPARITFLGEGPLPLPVEASLAQMAAGKLDGSYCQLAAVVRSVDDTTHEGLVRIELAGAEGRLAALVRNYHLGDCRRLVDAEARFAGVCFREPAVGDGISRVTLLVSGMGDITVIQPAAADPFSAERHSIQSLTRPGFNPIHRVRVRGTVSFYQREAGFYIQDGVSGLHVKSAQSPLLRAGDLVEAVGFSSRIENVPVVLENAIFRKIGNGPAPLPCRPTARELGDRSCLGRVITLETCTVSPWAMGVEPMRLQIENAFYTANLSTPSDEKAPRIRAGTKVRLTGVLVRCEGTQFDLVLQSVSDIRRLSGPTPSIVLMLLLSGVVLLSLLSLWSWKRRKLPQSH